MRRDQPHDRPEGGGLADPVAAEQGDDFAPAHLKRHIEKHMAFAEEGVHGVEGQHAQ
jgi:hypothetical protein